MSALSVLEILIFELLWNTDFEIIKFQMQLRIVLNRIGKIYHYSPLGMVRNFNPNLREMTVLQGKR